MSYPTDIDNPKDDFTNTTEVTDVHPTSHNALADGLVAVQTKVGVDSSADTDSLDYKVSNTSSESPGHKHAIDGDMTDLDNTAKADGYFLSWDSTSSKHVYSSTSAPDASTTVKGVTKLATAPASASNPIAVGDNDPRVPTTDENDALAGTSGAPSTSNKYVTADDVTEAKTASKIARRDSNSDVLVATTPTASDAATSKTYVDGTFVGAVVSDNLRESADTERTRTAADGTWEKKKEIVAPMSGTYRIKFDLKQSVQGSSSFSSAGRIYKDGAAVGTIRETSTNSYVTYSEDIYYNTGELIQAYVSAQYSGGGGTANTVNIQNFRVYFDYGSIAIGDLDLTVNTD